MNKIFVQPPFDSSFDEFLEFAIVNQYNIEIASFAYPDVLDGKWQKLVKKYKAHLKDFEGIISLHGAFFDLIVASLDKKVSKVAEERIYLNLEIAQSLNAKYVVFHANYNPSIRGPWYSSKWVKSNAAFWKKALKKYKTTIVLENFAEPNPYVLRQLLDEVDSSRLKICLDTGHMNVYSEVDAGEWFSVLGKDICYMHLNDNKGDFDAELITGRGNINWRKVSRDMSKIRPSVVLEVGTIEKTIKSLEYFKKYRIYPYDRQI